MFNRYEFCRDDDTRSWSRADLHTTTAWSREPARDPFPDMSRWLEDEVLRLAREVERLRLLRALHPTR